MQVASLSRVHADVLSRERFVRDFVQPGLPVIIEGAAEDWVVAHASHVSGTSWKDGRWTGGLWRRLLSSLCGSRTLIPSPQSCKRAHHASRGRYSLKRFDPMLAGQRWASQDFVDHELEGISTLHDFLAHYRERRWYLMDQSLDYLCPEMMAAIPAPTRLLPVDYMQQRPSERRGRHACDTDLGSPPWPSLFVGPEGSQSALHADASGSFFWLAVLEGAKRVRVFNASEDETAKLYPTEYYPNAARVSQHDYAYVFSADAFAPDLAAHPLLRDAVAWEGSLQAGDMIYIPPRWPHAFLNEQESIAVAYNGVDEYTLDEHLRSKLAIVVAGELCASERECNERRPAALEAAFEVIRYRYLAKGVFELRNATTLALSRVAAVQTMGAGGQGASSTFGASGAEDRDISWSEFFRMQQLDAQPEWSNGLYFDALSSSALTLLGGSSWAEHQSKMAGGPTLALKAEQGSSASSHNRLAHSLFVAIRERLERELQRESEPDGMPL